MSKSTLEAAFLTWWTRLARDYPEPVREYRFARVAIGDSPTGRARPQFRKRLDEAGLADWRFDFAWPSEGVALECNGGTWSNGRHSRGAGYSEDCRKLNAATALGWRVFQVTSDMLKADPAGAVELVKRALEASDN